jgi:hypothetical protein
MSTVRVQLASSSSSSSKSEKRLAVECHWSSWACVKGANNNKPTLHALPTTKDGAVVEATLSRPEEQQQQQKQGLFFWMLLQELVSTDNRQRKVYQYRSSEYVRLEPDKLNKDIPMFDGLVRIKITCAKMPDWYDHKTATKQPCTKEAIVAYEKAYSAALKSFTVAEFGQKWVTGNSITYPNGVSVPLSKNVVAFRDTPYGALPDTLWFERFSHAVDSNLMHLHADEFIFNLMRLVELASPTAAVSVKEKEKEKEMDSDNKQQSMRTMARLLLLLPRLIGSTYETTVRDNWSSPLSESDLSKISIDCEEMALLVACVHRIMLNTSSPLLKWMRSVSSFVLCHMATTSRDGTVIKTSKTKANQQLHITSMLFTREYWNWLTVREKTSTPPSKPFSCGALLEGLTDTCPFPCDKTGDTKDHHTGAEIEKSSWYETVICVFAEDPKTGRYVQFIPKDANGIPGCKFMDLWRASLQLSLLRFTPPDTSPFDAVASQSAYFCSLSFSREKALAKNSTKSKSVSINAATTSWKKLRFSSDKGQFYLTENSPLVELF